MPKHIEVGDTANERLKAGYSARLWASLIAATALHAAVFALWPDMQAEVLASAREATTVIQLPEVEIPPPPEAMPRPLGPIVASPDVSADFVPEMPQWRDVPEMPPPPPEGPTETVGATPFTAFTQAPRLLNGSQTQRVLERVYPSLLKDAGLGATVPLLIHVDVDGSVLESRVEATSGYESLDEAALRVAGVMEFSPAMNRDKYVAVWIRMPVTFRVR